MRLRWQCPRLMGRMRRDGSHNAEREDFLVGSNEAQRGVNEGRSLNDNRRPVHRGGTEPTLALRLQRAIHRAGLADGYPVDVAAAARATPTS